MSQYGQETEPGLVCLASRGDDLLFNGTIGMADMANNVQIDSDQIFRIAPITKQFTATAIMLLVEKGKLSLDDFVQDYIIGFDRQPPITIQQLLNHTSGLGNQYDIPEWKNRSQQIQQFPEGLIQLITEQPLLFEPGTQYQYSNLGYMTLGYLLEKVTSKSYEQFVIENILHPLQMNSSGFEHLEKRNNQVQGYSFNNGNYQISTELDMRIPYAAGGMYSTISDLQKWNQALFSDKILSQESRMACHQAHQLENGYETFYGLGWQIGNIQGRRTIKHDGIINGFTSIMLYVPEFDIQVILLSNCDCNRDIEIPA